ncbi:MAG: helix-turn-helix transcriptional regulator [Treponema sp.]|nr:helix-turn-helix transcriptional regulator [Treponema sp.]
MGFWKNVDAYLNFRGIPRKELAIGTGIKSQTIDRAIQRDSEPKFSEGLKVCRYLNVSVDEFIGAAAFLQNNNNPDNRIEVQKQINLYRKYHDLIANCELLSEERQKTVKQLVQSLAEAEPSYKSLKK